MRVLFLESHAMWIHGLPNGFRDAGHQVRVSGPLTEQNIPVMLGEFQPELIVTMGWTPENTGPKVDWIRDSIKGTNIPHVYWATEDPTHTERFTLPLLQSMKPDFVFSICPQRVALYSEMGIPSAHMDFAYHPYVHHYTGPISEYCCDIAVVANGYANNLRLYPKHYRIESLKTLIKPLIEAHIRTDFYGWGWPDMGGIIGCDIPAEWCHGPLEYTEANKVYSSAKLTLGLQNHPTQLTQRTYEILASGGVLLTSDTPAVRKLFEPGRDLLVSSSAEDTLRLVCENLCRDTERERLRERGCQSVLEHSYKKRADYMLEVLRVRGLLR